MPINRQASRMERYRYYFRAVATFLFSHIGLCAILVAYCSVGASIFSSVESDYEFNVRREVEKERDLYIEKLWDVAEKLQVLRQENWTEGAKSVLLKYEAYVLNVTRMRGYDGADSNDAKTRWDWMGSLLYSIIVITTIGYGDRTPRTTRGKVLTISYAIIGIPLMLLFLSNIGDVMANSFKFLYWKFYLNRSEKSRSRRRHGNVRRKRKRQRDGRTQEVEGENLPMNPITSTQFTDHQDASQVPIISNKYVLQSDNGNGASSQFRPQLPSTFKLPNNYGFSSSNRQKLPIFDTVMENDADDDYSSEEDDEDEGSYKDANVPISLCFTLVIGYICAGARGFEQFEEWSFAESVYFCFITLTTIGFGDFVPGESFEKEKQKLDPTVVMSFWALYLVLGMALLAMSLNLVRDAVANKVKTIGKVIGIVSDNDSDVE